MAHLRPISPNPLADSFSIVQMKDQNYAEIETQFVGRHRDQLCSYWNVIKNDTDCHKIRFNNNYDNPLILIQGWTKFKEFHNFPDNVEIQMIYHGNNLFEVSGSKELKSKVDIPPFHSMSLHPTTTATFSMKLKNIDFYSNMLTVEDDFAEFLDHFNVQQLFICGDKGQHLTVHVLNRFHDLPIKLGYNWDELCDSFNLKAGNTIQFKFERHGNLISSRCNLYKLE